MSESIILNGKEFLPAALAAKQAGFTRDYITRLCREKKIDAHRVGATWYVSGDSFNDFLVIKQFEKAQRRQALSEERTSHYQAAQTLGEEGLLEKGQRTLVGVPLPAAKLVPKKSAVQAHAHTFTKPVLTLAEEAREVAHTGIQKTQDTAAALRAAGERVGASPVARAFFANSMNTNMLPMMQGVAQGAHLAHKLAAVAFAFVFVFGSYSAVDAQYRRVALDTTKHVATTAMEAPAKIAALFGTPQEIAHNSNLAAAGFVSDMLSPLGVARDALSDFFSRAVSSAQSLAFLFADTHFAESGSVAVEIVPIGTAFTYRDLQKTSPQVVNQTIVQQPVIERIRETTRTVAVSGISQQQLADALEQLGNKLTSAISAVSASIPTSFGFPTTSYVNTGVFAQSNRIDNLSGVTISGGSITNATISGGSISGISLDSGDLTGAVSVGNGGTGTSTLPSYGQMLLGNVSGGYDLVATSSLGIVSGGLSSVYADYPILGDGSSGSHLSLAFGTSTANSWGEHNSFASLFATNASSTNATTTNLTVSGNASFAQATSSVFAVSDVLSPTTGSLYFGNAGANLSYNSSDYNLVGGSLYTTAGRIVAISNNETLGLGVRYVNGDGTYFIGATHDASPDLVFTNNGLAERARLTDAGNFGIGTTSPFAKLGVAGNTYLGGNLTATGTVQFTGLTSGLLYADASGTLASVATSTWTFASSTLLADNNTFSGSNTFSSNLTMSGIAANIALGSNYLSGDGGDEGVFVDGSGNVGIGTSTPLQLLHLASTGDAATLYSSSITGSSGNSGAAFSSNATNDTSNGSTISWVNPTNAQTNNSTGAYAIGIRSTNSPSTYLNLQNYGLSVPSNATINGVVVTISRYNTNVSRPVQDHTLSLIKGGTISGDNKADTATDWLANYSTATYGSSSDLWGVSLTPADVNASNFGVALAVKASSAISGTAPEVDYITITVYYSVSASTSNFTLGIDDSDSRKFKLSGSSVLGSNDYLTIDSTGSVGIGTTSPFAKLSVAGNTYLGGNLTATGTVQFTGLTGGLLYADSTGLLSSVATSTWTFASSTLLADNNMWSGINTFSSPLTLSGTSGTTTIASGQGFTVGDSQFIVQQGSGRVGIGTAAPTTGLDVNVATDISGDLALSGGGSLTISATGPILQTGTGQVTFAGNVDATNGLDVTTGNFTVGAGKFTVAPATGNTTIAGTLLVNGAISASSTLQVTSATRFYSTLFADGALTAAGVGTGLSVTNNATIGGTLGLTGAATFGSSLAVSGTLSAATTTIYGQLNINSEKITGVASPTSDSDAANKVYVDSVAQGLDLKEAVRVASVGNLTLSGEQTVDGVSLVAGERVLVKDELDTTKNGIYIVDSGAWTRAADVDENAEVGAGMFAFVQEGTINANSGWVLTTPGSITLGSTSLAFTQFSGAGQITAGTGIGKSGNTLFVGGTADRITANADSLDIASTYIGQSSITTVGALTAGSLGVGFGNINIGTASITAGAATFSSITGSAITGSGNLTVNGTGSFTGDVTISGTLNAAATTLSGNLVMGGNKITGLADPTSSQEAATKGYVDAIAQGLSIKAAAQVATTTNITLSGEQTIDGISAVAGNRVLVMGQTDATQNGIYVVAAGAWARASDADENSEVAAGMYAFVEAGTDNANTGWSLITSGAVTLGSTNLSFTQFSGSADITAGNGLTKSGNTINAGGTANRITIAADAIDIASTYIGQASITTVGTLTAGTIGSGFGAIDIGANTLSAGAGSFSSLASYGTLTIGGTATTTIQGNSATSTFSGGISLASGGINLPAGGALFGNNALLLSDTTLGTSVLGSSLTSVGALDAGQITTGFGAINIGADTLDAGATALASLTISGGATTTGSAHFASNVTIGSTNPLGLLDLYKATGDVKLVLDGGSGLTSYDKYVYFHDEFEGNAFSVGMDDSADAFQLSYGDGFGTNDLLTVTSSGSVGIGTTSPLAKLSVAGNTYLGGNLTATGTAQFTGLTGGLLYADSTGLLSNVATSTWTFASSTLLADNNTFSGSNTFSSNLTMSGTAANIVLGSNWLSGDGGDEGVFVDSTGKVGISNSNPTNRRLVVGNTGDIFNGVEIQADGGTSWYLDNRGTVDSPNARFALSTGGGDIITALSNGNVGIGTTTPAAPLNVSSASVGDEVARFQSGPMTGGTRQLRMTAGAGGGDAFDLQVYDNTGSYGSWSYLTLNSLGGNVGIGTTSPLAKLSVAGSTYLGGNLTATGTVQFTGLTGGLLYTDSTGLLSSVATSTWTFASSTLLADNNTWSGTNAFGILSATYASTTQIGSTGSAYFATSGGNVGIGTTSPLGKLDVNGGIVAGNYTNATSDSGFLIKRPGDATPRTFAIVEDDTELRIGGGAWTGINLYTSFGSNTMFLDGSTGNVGIGTTSPLAKLSIQGTAGANDIFNVASSTGASALYVNAAGNVGIGTTSPITLLTVNGKGGFGDSLTASNASRALNLVSSDAVMRILRVSADVNTAAPAVELMHRTTADGSNDSYWDLYADSTGLKFRDRENGSVIPFIIEEAAPTGSLYVASTGYVGIGTTSPSEALHVQGNFLLKNPANNAFIAIEPSSVSGNPIGRFQSTETGSGTDTGFMLSLNAKFQTSDDTYQRDNIGQEAARLFLDNLGDFTYSWADTGSNPITWSDRFYIDGSTGNVGIGTSSPLTKLSIQGTAGANDLFNIASSTGASLLYVNAAGNVGIGTTTPSFALDVSQPSSVGSSIGARFYNDNSINLIRVANNVSGTLSSAPAFGSNSTAAVIYTSNSERMRIDSSGNVGIGTTTPDAKLHVYAGSSGSAFKVGTTTSTFFSIDSTTGVSSFGQSSGTGDAIFQIAGDTNAWALGYKTSDKSFRIASSTALDSDVMFTLLKSGKVGIGTTLPQGTLQVGSSYSTAGTQTARIGTAVGAAGTVTSALHLDANPSTAYDKGVSLDFGYNDSTNLEYTSRIVHFGNTSATRASKLQLQTHSSSQGVWNTGILIDDVGRVGIGTTAPNNGKVEVKGGTVCVDTNSDDVANSCIANESDERLKTNITSISASASLQTILALNPVSFDWRASDPEILQHYSLLGRFASSTHSIGLIAQQVAPLVPEAIELETVGDDEVQYLQLDYTKITPHLIGAVKELNTRTVGLASAATTPQLFIDASGNVGIGTSTPNYDLQVVGDIAAASFVNTSTREAKKDISYLTDTNEDDTLAQIAGLKLATYNYTFEQVTSGMPLHLGLIAEEAPSAVLSADAKGVDLYKLATFTLAGVKAQQRQIADLGVRVGKLEEALASASAAGSEVNPIVAMVQGWLEGIGITVSDSMAKFNSLAAAAFTVGSPEKPSGITLYDEATGEPYCVRINGGSMVSSSGACTTEGVGAHPAPVIAVQGNNPAAIALGATYNDLGVIARDWQGNDLSVKYYVNGTTTPTLSLDTSTSTTYTIHYVTMDTDGMWATSTRMVLVGNATTTVNSEQGTENGGQTAANSEQGTESNATNTAGSQATSTTSAATTTTTTTTSTSTTAPTAPITDGEATTTPIIITATTTAASTTSSPTATTTDNMLVVDAQREDI